MIYLKKYTGSTCVKINNFVRILYQTASQSETSSDPEEYMKKYTKVTDVSPCRLTRADLIQIEEVIRGDIGTKKVEDFNVNSNLSNVNISENSINDFLNHKDLPKIISRLSISIIGWSKENSIDKSINLTFYDNFITLKITGDSETWVNGKFLQLDNLLKTKRPTLWFLKTAPVYILRGALFVILFLGFGEIVRRIISGGLDSIGISLPLMIVAISLFDTTLSKFRYIKIYIEEKKSFIEKYKSLFVILGAIGTIFAIIIQILDIIKK